MIGSAQHVIDRDAVIGQREQSSAIEDWHPEGLPRPRQSYIGVPILYRAALLPLSDDGGAIDHVLGAANHRTLLADEPTTTRVVRKRWI